MEVLVSVLASKNLSQSALITRNICSTLEVGGAAHRSGQLEVEDVAFKVGSADAQLVVTLRNSQTQTVLFVRNVPLSLVSGQQQVLVQWIAVYSPGDPRNSSFDEDRPPLPDAPQIHLLMRCVGRSVRSGSPGSSSLCRPGSSASSGIETDIRPSTDVRPSLLDREAVAIREKERQAEDIKQKLSKMSSARRQAQSTEQQLQEVNREIDALKQQVEQAELDLRAATVARTVMEREKHRAREACSEAQEVLRMRELSLLELRSTRDEAERQLAQALADREQKRSSIDSSMRNFNDEAKGLSEELDRWRSEAVTLFEKRQQCDKELLRIEEENSQGGEAAGAGAELEAVQRQLAEAEAELEAVRQSAAEAATQQQSAEDNLRVVTAELDKTQASAELQRQRTRELHSEADSAEKELVVEMGRAAQLEGQVSETRNLLKDMEARLADILAQVTMNQNKHSDLEQTVSVLQHHITSQDTEADDARDGTASLEAKLRVIREEVVTYQQRTAELEEQRQQAQESRVRKSIELDTTRRVVESAMRGVGDESVRLRGDRARLERELAGLEGEASDRTRLQEETEQRVRAAERELAELGVARRRQDAEEVALQSRLTALEPELREAERQLQEADEEAARLRDEAAAKESEHRRRERALEDEVGQLRSELLERQLEAQSVELDHTTLVGSLGESKRIVPERQARVAGLRVSQQELKEESVRLRSGMAEVRHALAQQAEKKQRLRQVMSQDELELTSASSSAVANARRREELERDLEATKASWGSRSAAAQAEVREAEEAREQAVGELGRLRAERAKLAAQHADIRASCLEASTRISGLRTDSQAASSSDAALLCTMQADRARYVAEEAQHAREGRELEDRVARLLTEAEEEIQGQAKAQAALDAQRRELDETTAALRSCERELEAAEGAQPAAEAERTKMQDRSEALERRVAQMRAQLKEFQATSEHANRLRAECDAAAAARLAGLDEQTRAIATYDEDLAKTCEEIERTSAARLEEKNGDLDRWIERIDALEREVQTLASNAEASGKERDALVETLATATASKDGTHQEASKQDARLAAMQAELRSLRDNRSRLEATEGLAQLLSVQQEATVNSEVDAQRAASQLTDFTTRMTSEAEEEERKLQAMQGDVATQAELTTAASSAAQKLTSEVSAAAARRDSAKRQLEQLERERERAEEQLKQVEAELETAKQERKEAELDATQQLENIELFEREEIINAAAAQDVLKGEEQKVRLLQDQITSREDAIFNAQTEEADLLTVKQELIVEIEDLQQHMHSLGEKLANLVEHGNIQFATVEEMEEIIRGLEADTELLTLGLHDSEKRGEALQQENQLMKQMVEGIYDGSLQEWALELHRVKAAAEVQKHEDELSHWKSVAEEAERELQVDVHGAQQQQQSEVEEALQLKARERAEELAQVKQTLRDLMCSSAVMEAAGAVHSVPAPLHGLLAPLRPLAPEAARRRKALVVGCNYSQSHVPLQGCSNDAWNLQCLLRHSYHYDEDQVRCLIDGSQHCPSPPGRQPTKANILSGLRWLAQGAGPGDNLAFFFCGYGTQQPLQQMDGLCAAHLVPSDFAKDLPSGFFPNAGSAPGSEAPQDAARQAVVNQAISTGCCYRLVSLVEVSNLLAGLPAGCKATLVLDCCHSVLPNVAASGPVPAAFPPVVLDVNPIDFMQPGAPGARPILQPRFIDLPPLPTPPLPVAPSPPQCCCHCYSACQNQEWCAELLIEGIVQGAFTWAFVKALTAGHLDSSVQQHNKALDGILGDLRHRFRWLDQNHVLQLSGAAKMQDQVLLP